MAAGINVLLILTALHLASSLPKTLLEPKTEDPINFEDEDPLNHIYMDIENYTDNINIIKNNLLRIKHRLESSKVKIVTKANYFKKEIESEENVYKKEFTGYYNEHDCIYRGINCRVEEDPDKCSRNLLNKTEYIESIDIFIKLLFIDFKEKLHNFDKQLEEMSIEVGTIKMLAYLKYIGHKLNDTDLIASKIDEWKNATFKKLDNHLMKLSEKANELISAFKKLSREETSFEKEILKEMKEKKLLYGCCVKKFKFEIEGLECSPPPLRYLPPPPSPPPPSPSFSTYDHDQYNEFLYK